MKTLKVLIGSAVACVLFVSCSTRGKHLEVQTIPPGIKTALVIDTEFFSLLNEPPNHYNLKCENLGKEKCKQVFAWLHQAEPHRRELLAYLAQITRVRLRGKGLPNLNIDPHKHFDSKQFLLKYPKERWNYCSLCRDFSHLREQGYTHVLFAGFPNRVIVEGPHRGVYYLGLAFGIDTYLYDIRSEAKDVTDHDKKINRMAWCYYLSPSQKKTQKMTYTQRTDLVHGYYDTTTYTTVHYPRNCLRVLMVKENAKKDSYYSLEEIFTGSYPLYLEIYKRAAGVNLQLSRQHLSGQKITKEKELRYVSAWKLLSGQYAK